MKQPPPILGGQGRDAESLLDSASALAYLAIVALGLVCWILTR